GQVGQIPAGGGRGSPLTPLAVEGPTAVQDTVDGPDGWQGLDPLVVQFVADGLGTMKAEVAVLSQVFSDPQDQGFQVGVGATRVMRCRRPIGPIDPVEAWAFGASDPAEDRGRADTELLSYLVERAAPTHGGHHSVAALGDTSV